MNKAIVIGGNHHNTLGVVRSLGRMGLRPDVIVPEAGADNFIRRSRYIGSFISLPSYNDLVPYLKEQYGKEQYKPVIFCCCDRSSSEIDLRHKELEDSFELPGIASDGRVTELMNKQIMAQLALEANLTVSPGRILDAGSLSVPSRLDYPVIVKPLASISGTKKDIEICRNSAELKAYLAKASHPVLQLQKFIDKEFEYQLIGCSADGGNSVVIPGRSRIIHQPQNTNTGFLHYEELDGKEPLEQCRRFLKMIGYSGLFSMEFLRGKDGKDYFMEINFRNDGNAICVTDCGVNLPYLWYKLNSDKDFSLPETAAISPKYVIPEFEILDLWYQGHLSFKQMLSDFRNADSFMDYAPDDPRPTQGIFGIVCHALVLALKKPLRNVAKKILSHNS